MTPSLQPHCSLTEAVCKTMSGKGREGIRKGMEGKIAFLLQVQSVQLLEARASGRLDLEC